MFLRLMVYLLQLWSFVFVFILIELELFYNVGGLGHAFPESPKYRHNTSLGIELQLKVNIIKLYKSG